MKYELQICKVGKKAYRTVLKTCKESQVYRLKGSYNHPGWKRRIKVDGAVVSQDVVPAAA